MKTKKVFRRLCLTNWGGVDHQILELNEYVNLFSGKSGSGKSTAMDAIQVILYGSISSNFLNRAADDNKNKRSVMGYLRGEQKDGTANRQDVDFCSVIALEIEDMYTNTKACVGLNFEVRKKDNELRKFVYFSHAGSMPENGYIDENGVPFSIAQMKKLVEQRAKEKEHGGPAEVNGIYTSKERYLTNLYSRLLGWIDGNRFVTMEKSAIALRMTDGTGQFIKDYMFPKGTGDAIEKLSEQLGAYRDICERIEDIKKRIDLLQQVQAAGIKYTTAQADEIHQEQLLRCLEIEDARSHIVAWHAQKESVDQNIHELQAQLQQLQKEEEERNEQWAQAKADLQSSDLGRKQEHLEELTLRSQMLSANVRRWREITGGLQAWGQDEYVNDYISQNLLKNIDDFVQDAVTKEQCMQLSRQITEEKQQLESELGMLQDELREVKKQLDEKRRQVEDMQHNRKSYGEQLRRARKELENQLQMAAGKQAKVYILADLFDIDDQEWKHAVEGCMGKMRFALVTEPRYALEGARQFKKLRRYDNIDFLNTKALEESKPKEKPNSLYEAVSCREEYVAACLRHFLGKIIKCETEEEMIAAGNAVTKSCYSYHNYMFRHLRRKDYENSFIGTKVSKAKLGQYEEDLEKLEKKFTRLTEQVSHMKQIYQYQTLEGNPEDYVALSKSGEELETIVEQIGQLRSVLQQLEQGEWKELQEREAQLHKEYNVLRKKTSDCNSEIARQTGLSSSLQADIRLKQEELDRILPGYVENATIKTEVQEEWEHNTTEGLRRKYVARKNAAMEKGREALEERGKARQNYISNYPNCEFTGMERDNRAYDEKLLEYQKNYEPKYEEEFEKQCAQIYKSLRDNVIAKIHGDMKAAHRHKREINRLLRDTNFADSRYQIDIEAAQNADGQFYDMLMAEELDTKNPDNEGFEGQMSLGEDVFYQKYEAKIQLLMEKFMPVKNADDAELKKHQEEMEKYADYRTYLSFRMNEIVTDADGKVVRKNYVDEMAGKDSGGEGQNPKYVALLAGFAMLYMAQTNRDSKIKLVLLDEPFSKMDQERSAVCLQYARKMDLQLIVCVPDERLQSLIRNVDCVYGFRRENNRISMMHIDKGEYLQLMEGDGE